MCLLSFLLVAVLPSYSISLTGTEGVGNPLLDLGLGARPLGCGGAFVAVPADANSGYWNPAGLGPVTNATLTSMYTTLFLGTKFYYLGITTPLSFGKGAGTNSALRLSPRFGSVSILWVESFVSGLKNTKEAFDPATGLPYTQYDDFTSLDDALMLAYGYRPISWLSLGWSVKYSFRKIDIQSARGSGWGCDAGIQAVPFRRFTIGALVQDVGSTVMHWSFTDESNRPQRSSELIVSRLKVGCSFDFIDLFRVVFDKGDAEVTSTNSVASAASNAAAVKTPSKFSDLIDGLLLSLEVRWQMERKNVPTYHFGMEWSIYDMVFLRMGFDDVNFTAGVGIRSRYVSLDYAYVTHPDLDNTHRISLTARY